jgi:hypothetical protein
LVDKKGPAEPREGQPGELDVLTRTILVLFGIERNCWVRRDSHRTAWVVIGRSLTNGRHTALATRPLGVATGRGQDARAERERCAAIVERWNAAPTHDWSPAIGTALKAAIAGLLSIAAGAGR